MSFTIYIFKVFNIHVPSHCFLFGLCAFVERRSLCMFYHMLDLLFTIGYDNIILKAFIYTKASMEVNFYNYLMIMFIMSYSFGNYRFKYMYMNLLLNSDLYNTVLRNSMQIYNTTQYFIALSMHYAYSKGTFIIHVVLFMHKACLALKKLN